MNRDVRKLTDGAMMTAIFGVLLVVNRQLGGLLESMVLFLFPIPMVFYSARYGWKDSWLPYAAMVILAFVLGTPQTVFYVASESMMGMVYGSGIYAKKELRKLVIVTMLIGVAVDLLSTVIFAAFFGYDLTADTAAMTTQMNQIMSQAGVSLPATVDLTQLIKTVIILSAVLSGILEALVTHLLSLLLLKRMRYNVPKATPIALYFPPLWSGYAGLAGPGRLLLHDLSSAGSGVLADRGVRIGHRRLLLSGHLRHDRDGGVRHPGESEDEMAVHSDGHLHDDVGAAGAGHRRLPVYHHRSSCEAAEGRIQCTRKWLS
jgi:hypothetical protein